MCLFSKQFPSINRVVVGAEVGNTLVFMQVVLVKHSRNVYLEA
jgi:hypothetical protein